MEVNQSQIIIPKTGQKYYHLKHNPSKGELDYCYEVIGVGKHTESREDMVIYKLLYECEVEMFVRPLTMFLEIVDKPEYNYVGARFRLDRQILEK